jgi:hypothetical protein
METVFIKNTPSKLLMKTTQTTEILHSSSFTDDRSPIHEHFHMIIILIKSIHWCVHMIFIGAEQVSYIKMYYRNWYYKIKCRNNTLPQKTNSIEFSANQLHDCCLGSENYGIMEFEQLRTLLIFAPPKKILALQRSFQKKILKPAAWAKHVGINTEMKRLDSTLTQRLTMAAVVFVCAHTSHTNNAHKQQNNE